MLQVKESPASGSLAVNESLRDSSSLEDIERTPLSEKITGASFSSVRVKVKRASRTEDAESVTLTRIR